jgi:hypothetical protein
MTFPLDPDAADKPTKLWLVSDKAWVVVSIAICVGETRNRDDCVRLFSGELTEGPKQSHQSLLTSTWQRKAVEGNSKSLDRIKKRAPFEFRTTTIAAMTTAPAADDHDNDTRMTKPRNLSQIVPLVMRLNS